MKQYIDKAALVAEIKKIYNEDYKFLPSDLVESVQNFKDDLLRALDTLEVKDVKDNELTWENIRELHIIFTEVDVEIELGKIDIKTETLGYYEEVLNRFKDLKK